MDKLSYLINYKNNDNSQVTQAVKVLQSWIGEPKVDSGNILKFLTLDKNAEDIQILNSEQTNKIQKPDDFLILNDVTGKKNEICIIAQGDRGLANGIYYLHMKLKEQQIKDPFSVQWNIFETPYFETRGMTMFNLPFYLKGLCTDTWTVSEWIEYLNRLRSFNYTTVIYAIHAGMLYNPEFEELRKNEWIYNVCEEVIDYAKTIGLETVILIVFNEFPPELWIKYPNARGYLNLAQGLTYCSEKGKELGETVLQYTLQRFKNVDAWSLFAFEGGGCKCDYCHKNVVDLVVDFIDFIKTNTDSKILYFCTWFAYVHEKFYSPKVKGLRKDLFAKIPKGTKIFDVSRQTLKMAQNQGLEVFDFLFLMDPEDGFENSLIFPKPLLHTMKERIIDSIQNLKPRGIFGYRLLPKARFINDYAFARYLWNPQISIEDVISEIAGLLSARSEDKEQIQQVIQLIEEFWNDLAEDKLRECEKLLNDIIENKENILEPLKSIQEAVIILNLLFQYYSNDSERKRKSITNKIFRHMLYMDTFQCYTTHKLWEIVALETIKERIRWWTDPKRGLFNPTDFPWNCIREGKYHLIENKKDVLEWISMKDALKAGAQLIASKFKKKI